MRKFAYQLLFTILMIALLGTAVFAQEYVSPIKPAEKGRSPGVKVKLVSQNGTSKTYAVIFAKGDEILSGLNEFAEKYQVKNARFTAIGDATSAKLGWYDKSKKMFKVINITEPAEVTSLVAIWLYIITSPWYTPTSM
ncbi:MAG: DUF296 domain-containing protein [Flavobacterium sp.]|nr:MAG: DUF296 domain-containing protein [Flavobacterium sp.]